MILLTKLSEPGFEKYFDNDEGAANFLIWNHYICDGCILDTETIKPNLSDLLATACGCEFYVEDVE